MTAAQLRNLCETKGLVAKDHKILTKAEMVKILRTAEEGHNQTDGQVDGSQGPTGDATVDVENDDVIDDDVDDNVSNVARSNYGDDDDDGDAEISVQPHMERESKNEELRLKIELAKLQLERAKLHPTSHSGGSMSPQNLRGLLPSMGGADNADSVLSFFFIFEKTLTLHDVPQEMWGKLLPACLNARASKVYGRLGVEECRDYFKVKAAILDSQRLNARVYLERFRSARRTGGSESYKLFLNRLSDLQQYYLDSKQISTFDQLKNDMLLEAFMSSLPSSVRSFVETYGPTSAADAAKYADLCYEVNRTQNQGNRDVDRKPYAGKNEAGIFKGVSKDSPVEAAENDDALGRKVGHKISCYICGGPHKKSQCNFRNNVQAADQKGLHASTVQQQQQRQRNPGANGRGPYNAALVHGRRGGRGSIFDVSVIVENVYLRGLRDTGSEYTIVNSKYIPPKAMLDEKVPIAGINGVTQTMQFAMVKLRSPKFQCVEDVSVKVGVLDDLNWDILIGNQLFIDYPILKDIICLRDEVKGTTATDVETVSANAITRAQSHKMAAGDGNSIIVDNGVSGSEPAQHGIPPFSEQRHGPDDPRNFKDGEVCRTEMQGRGDSGSTSTQPVDVTVTEAQQEVSTKRKQPDSATERASVTVTPPGHSRSGKTKTDMQSSSKTAVKSAGQPRQTDAPSEVRKLQMEGETSGDVDAEFARLSSMEWDENRDAIQQALTQPTEFMTAQRSDSSLQSWWSRARQGSTELVIRDGVLYKQRLSGTRADNELLLVVPTQYRKQILECAHQGIEIGCHQGIAKTRMKINRVFAWPKDAMDISKYVKGCLTCARLAPRNIDERAPLLNIPVIGEAFKEWTIDVIGPSIDMSKRRKLYVLVAVCNATRWTELIVLNNLTAKSVLEGLTTNLFARFGTCATLRYDMSSAMMSNLMQALLKELGVESKVAIAGYHAGVTALAERYVRTTSNMIKSYIHDQPRSWREMLAHFAFCLRETPCETLGFSAHELVMGRNLSNEMQSMRERWLGIDLDEGKKTGDVVTYLNDLRQKLDAVNQLAQQHAAEMQSKTKVWYDKHSTERALEPGDFVLILIPDDDRKLYMRWSEPKCVVRRVDARNYLIDLGHRQALFHVNQLRKYDDKTPYVNAVITVDPIDSENDLLPLIDWEETVAEFNVGTHLTDEQQREMRELLAQFPTVLTSRLGATHLVEHSIKLRDDTPCVAPIYRTPHSLRPAVEAEIQRLLDAGIIQPSESSYRAPIVPVLKPDKTVRLCVNYKLLNAKTIDDLHPLSDANEVLSQAAGAAYITKIDLSSAFYQVPLQKDCRHYTAFQCHLGLFEFKFSPMGLKNSPRTLDRLVRRLVRAAGRHDCSNASSFLDDVIISSKSWPSHIAHTRAILTQLRDANLTANVRKSQFCLRSMEVLGHCLEDGVIKMSPSKVQAIMDIGPCKTKNGIRAILGMAGYYRMYFSNFAEITNCFTELLKKNMPERIKWEQKHSDALEEIKRVLMNKPVLVAPDHNKDYIMQTDATQNSVAAVLSQLDDNGQERVVAYASRRLLPRERNYSVMEKECLGILFGVQKWNTWVYGKKVVVQSDHRSLQWLDSIAKSNARMARWNLIFQNYDLTTVYRKSSLHGNADSLSRIESTADCN